MPGISKSKNLADRIFADLQRQILTDELGAGERLMSERNLAAALNTNRNTLREAIRKLEQTRLVSVRHGAGVTVSDFRQTGLMDVLVPFLEHGRDNAERVGIILDLLAMRTEVLSLIVALASERADGDDLQRLQSACASQLAAFEAGDRMALSKGDVGWLNVLVDASHSLTMRWVTNSILEVYDRLSERFPALWLLEPSYPEFMRTLVAAIAERDGERARRVTRSYYQRNDARVRGVLETLIGQMSWQREGDDGPDD